MSEAVMFKACISVLMSNATIAEKILKRYNMKITHRYKNPYVVSFIIYAEYCDILTLCMALDDVGINHLYEPY